MGPGCRVGNQIGAPTPEFSHGKAVDSRDFLDMIRAAFKRIVGDGETIQVQSSPNGLTISAIGGNGGSPPKRSVVGVIATEIGGGVYTWTPFEASTWQGGDVNCSELNQVTGISAGQVVELQRVKKAGDATTKWWFEAPPPPSTAIKPGILVSSNGDGSYVFQPLKTPYKANIPFTGYPLGDHDGATLVAEEWELNTNMLIGWVYSFFQCSDGKWRFKQPDITHGILTGGSGTNWTWVPAIQPAEMPTIPPFPQPTLTAVRGNPAGLLQPTLAQWAQFHAWNSTWWLINFVPS